MFLPVLKASFISSDIFTDGTTKPLLVKADDGKDYVVKIFSKRNASQRPYTAAEAYAHYLAQQFDLRVPAAVFMDIPTDLLELYKNTDPDFYSLLSTKDTGRPCFGTEYLGTLPPFSPALARKYIEIHDLACIYAFDMLILNEDRKKLKPNLLKARENCVLIDHDKAFEGIPYHTSFLKQGVLPFYCRNHLFYKLLKKLLKSKV